MLAPRNPTSVAALSFPLLFRSGNLYLRTPQARLNVDSRDRTAVKFEPLSASWHRSAVTTERPLTRLSPRRSPASDHACRVSRAASLGSAATTTAAHHLVYRVTTVASDRRHLGDELCRRRRLSRAGRTIWVGRRGVLWRQPGCLWWRAQPSFGIGGRFPRDAPEARPAVGGRFWRRDGSARDPVLLTRNNSAYSSLTFRPTPEVVNLIRVSMAGNDG